MQLDESGNLFTDESLGFTEYEAQEYQGHLKQGRALISVRVADSDEVTRAKKVFNDAGASHISVKSVEHAK
jgi:hypothetical protein